MTKIVNRKDTCFEIILLNADELITVSNTKSNTTASVL